MHLVRNPDPAVDTLQQKLGIIIPGNVFSLQQSTLGGRVLIIAAFNCSGWTGTEPVGFGKFIIKKISLSLSKKRSKSVSVSLILHLYLRIERIFIS